MQSSLSGAMIVRRQANAPYIYTIYIISTTAITVYCNTHDEAKCRVNKIIDNLLAQMMVGWFDQSGLFMVANILIP